MGYTYITDILDKAIEERDKKSRAARKKREPKRFWPSSSSVVTLNEHGEQVVEGQCMRSEYWSIKGETPTNPTNARGIRIMEAGKRVEDLEVEAAKEAGILVDAQRKFQHQLPDGIVISGALDAVFKIDGKVIGVEYKSGYGQYFRKAQMGIGADNSRLKDFKPAPKTPHLLQVMMYLDHYRGEIDTFYIIYHDRGDGTYFEFKVELDKDGFALVSSPVQPTPVRTPFSVASIYARYVYLSGFLEEGRVPPPDFEVFYTEARVKELSARTWWDGGLSKAAKKGHDDYLAGDPAGRQAGYFMCQGYCPYENKCKALVKKEMSENKGEYERVSGVKPAERSSVQIEIPQEDTYVLIGVDAGTEGTA